MLLAPKPPKAQEQEEIKTKELGNQVGRSRFNNTVGFDAAPQLAQLASRVPIPFGRYEEYITDVPENEGDVGETGYPSGGFIVEPLLVWSRMLSNGSFQSLKVQMVLGQSGIATPPSIEGVMIGGQPIAQFYKTNYAVFWKSVEGSNRLAPSNLIAGDAAPDGNWGVPTATGPLQPGFSAAYSPSNSTEFGVYNSIPNGGHYRVNWRVVSIPRRKGQPDDPGGRLSAQIEKITGDNDWGMVGIGRWYSTRMGLTHQNGQSFTDVAVVQASRDDTFTFTIRGTQVDGNDLGLDTDDTGVTGDDINNTLNSERERVDALLQRNEVLLCNRTLMRVESRPNQVFDPLDATDMTYELKVIGFTGANRDVGMAGTDVIDNAVLAEPGGVNPNARSVSWYPLHKVDVGQVSNTRKCEVTELGIRSQVWSQANGLCNFNEIPSPERLQEFNQDEYQITSGTMSKYMSRTSFFVLGIRPINGRQGLDSNGQDLSDDDGLFDGFDILNGVLFAVRGNSPVDQYNYLRVYHPTRAQYEFRLIPKDACNVHRYASYEGQAVYVLDVAGDVRSYSETIVYGTFRLEFSAMLLDYSKLFQLPEMATDPKLAGSGFDCTLKDLNIVGVTNSSGIAGPQGGGYSQGYYEEILGQLKDPSDPGGGDKKVFGESATVEFSFTSRGVTFNCTMRGTVGDYSSDQAFVDKNGTAKAWEGVSVEVRSVDGNVQDGEQYLDSRQMTRGWYSHKFGLRGQDVYFAYGANATCIAKPPEESDERVFEEFAQIKELSCYTEKVCSCDNGPEHSVLYINESQDNLQLADYNNLTMMGIKLRTMNQVASFQQPQIYLKNGIDIERLAEGGTGPSSNFADIVYWLLTRQGASIGQEISSRLVDKQSFIDTAKFLETTRLRFDGALTDAVNLRSFITQLAPLYLCNFIIKNGKFALEPAVPVDSSGALLTSAVPTANIFTDGNIVDGSFELNYIDQQDREDFRAVIEYRELPINGLVEKKTIMVKWKDEPGTPPAQESIDGSQYISRRGHAFIAARYLLSTRRRIDHVISFKTQPQGIGIAPGDYIKVETEASPLERSLNVVINQDLSFLSPTDFTDGEYTAFVYRQGADEAREETVTFKDGKVADPSLAYALMNIPTVPRRWGVYQIDKITLEEDGLVQIEAAHHPVFADGRSKIVDDILHANRYEKFEVIE